MPVFGRTTLFRGLSCLLLLTWLGVGGMGLQACETTTGPSDGCKSNNDCAKEKTKKVCDRNKEICVQCIETADCGKNEICDAVSKSCLAGCSTAADCKDKFPGQPNAKIACVSQACVVKCDTKADCKADERCRANTCIENKCTDTSECGKGEKCDAKRCIPAVKLSGKFGPCEGPENCEEGLKCLTYKGGTSNACWKPCGNGCNKDEVCVDEKSFAEGYSVCMTAVRVDGSLYSYATGTACAKGLITLTHGSVDTGSCWKDCKNKCLGGKKCLPHPNVKDNPPTLCFKPCKADSDCPTDVYCKQYSESNGDFYCIP